MGTARGHVGHGTHAITSSPLGPAQELLSQMLHRTLQRWVSGMANWKGKGKGKGKGVWEEGTNSMEGTIMLMVSLHLFPDLCMGTNEYFCKCMGHSCSLFGFISAEEVKK